MCNKCQTFTQSQYRRYLLKKTALIVALGTAAALTLALTPKAFAGGILPGSDPWSTLDKQREVGYLALHIIDWGQTVTIAKNCPEKFTEVNVILGECPSVGKVNTYFALTAIGHVVVTDLLPSEYRPKWQWGGIALEAAVVVRNDRMGVQFTMPLR